MADGELDRVTPEDLGAEGATALPDKEVLSLLDLNADIDLALDTAAPIDLAIGANANVAAPIDAAVGANVLSPGAASEAAAVQGAAIHQGITGDATATSDQDSSIAQGDPTTDATTGATSGGTTTTIGDPTDGDLLNVNVNLDGNLHLASPIDGAVAANANVAAPINAAASANIGSPDAESVAVAQQTAVIDQSITGDATATGDQTSDIVQGPAPTEPAPTDAASVDPGPVSVDQGGDTTQPVEPQSGSQSG